MRNHLLPRSQLGLVGNQGLLQPEVPDVLRNAWHIYISPRLVMRPRIPLSRQLYKGSFDAVAVAYNAGGDGYHAYALYTGIAAHALQKIVFLPILSGRALRIINGEAVRTC